MKRIFSWAFGVSIPTILLLSFFAYHMRPSVFTFAAAVIMFWFHALFWVGAGRAIFDAYLHKWKSREKI